ncbi:MAG: hypothetical protein NVSMB26_03080 [Beijerinckiaceae bacterium]
MGSGKARECGTCTACCDGWLRIEVRGHDVRPGTPCPFSSGHHCTIYSTRPENPCQKFVCGWLTPNSPLPEQMRPDQAGMILLPANFDWRGRPVDVAVRVGPRPKKSALEWLKTFTLNARRLLLYQIEDEWFAFGPPAFQTEMQERIASGDKPWT